MFKKIFQREVKEEKKYLLEHEERPDEKASYDNKGYTQEEKKKDKK